MFNLINPRTSGVRNPKRSNSGMEFDPGMEFDNHKALRYTLWYMESILKNITDKKKQLDQYKPFPKVFIENMEQWYKIELTYSSNAIEGNTLTRQQTAQIVEKGITVKGKSITEHLEAVNHAKAYEYIKLLNLNSAKEINKRILLDLHAIILRDIDTTNAGVYRSTTVRIAGSRVTLPNPLKVPELVDDFFSWLHHSSDNIIKTAVDAHFKLVSIHPFTDGNGRCARLLMNLILIISGYPPTIIKKENREQYISSIERGQLTQNLSDYYYFMFKAIDKSLDTFLKALKGKFKKTSSVPEQLMKIGELAKRTNETVSTIRFWTKQGLLKVKDFSRGGYQLYDQKAIERIKKIRKLKKEKRLTIAELKFTHIGSA
jgi:Fic family protein